MVVVSFREFVPLVVMAVGLSVEPVNIRPAEPTVAVMPMPAAEITAARLPRVSPLLLVPTPTTFPLLVPPTTKVLVPPDPVSAMLPWGSAGSGMQTVAKARLDLTRVTAPFVLADIYATTGKTTGSNTPVYVDDIYWAGK